MNLNISETKIVTVPADLAKKRLDQVLAILFPEYSRSRLTHWLELGLIKLDTKICKPKEKVKGGEHITLQIPKEEIVSWEGEPLPLNILYEDDDILVINKPKNCVTHPASGHMSGTLVNALLHHFPALKEIPRAGIVHRLDKDTTGVLVVAKTLPAHTKLVKDLSLRVFKREYDALVVGEFVSGGTVDAPLGRHPKDRKKRAVLMNGGKKAVTHYRIAKRFKDFTLLKITLETGRTHQIRVHMAHIHHPIVGDKLYGGRLRFPPKASDELKEMLQHFPRQALHARKLGLNHPRNEEYVEWEAEMPEDMVELIKVVGEH